MTKEQFIDKWENGYDSLGEDLEAVIATEIAKVKEQPQPSDKVQISKHTLVEVNRAFRALKRDTESYIHKVFGDDGVFDAMNEIRQVHEAHFGNEERQIKPEESKPQPELNPIEQAYERGEKIRQKKWLKNAWIQKLSETESTSDTTTTFANYWDFTTNPEKWEIYKPKPTEQVPEPTEQPAQPSSQAKLDNSFDVERFERMFCAVVVSGEWHGDEVERTEYIIKELDAYYASKEGGNNE